MSNKLFYISIFLFFLLSASACAQSVVIVHKNQVVLNAGSNSLIKQGQNAYVIVKLSTGKRSLELRIAKLKILKVEQKSSIAEIVNKCWCVAVKPGMKVVIAKRETRNIDISPQAKIEKGKDLFFYLNQAKMCIKERKYEQCKIYLEQILKELPEDIIANRLMRQVNELIEQQKWEVEREKKKLGLKKHFIYLLKTARQLEQEGDDDTAIIYFNIVFKIHPENQTVKKALANLYIKQSHAAAKNKDYIGAFQYLGKAAVVVGASIEVVKSLNEVLASALSNYCLDRFDRKAIELMKFVPDTLKKNVEVKEIIYKNLNKIAEKFIKNFEFRDAIEVYRWLGINISSHSAEINEVISELSPKPFSNSFGMSFVYVQPGVFYMGTKGDKLPGNANEKPLHKVIITNGYYIGTTEVTQGQWIAVMGHNPSYFKHCGTDCPVENISWNDVQKFIEKLNLLDSEWHYRLPTEAEWEYVCRAGTETDTYAGDLKIVASNNAPLLDSIAWYGGNSGVTYKGGWDSFSWEGREYFFSKAGTHPVAQKKPNAWGVYDMLGNVWEWCQDWYSLDYYKHSPVKDPTGSSFGNYKILRGGSWDCLAVSCRSALRSFAKPDKKSPSFGFRLVATPKK